MRLLPVKSRKCGNILIYPFGFLRNEKTKTLTCIAFMSTFWDWQVSRDSPNGGRSQQHSEMSETHRWPCPVPHIPDPQRVKGEVLEKRLFVFLPGVNDLYCSASDTTCCGQSINTLLNWRWNVMHMFSSASPQYIHSADIIHRVSVPRLFVWQMSLCLRPWWNTSVSWFMTSFS